MDLVAETFAKAFVSRGSFRGRDDRAAAAWLYAIARNELAAYFRRGAVEREAMEKLGLRLAAPSAEDIERVEELAGLSATSDALAAEVERLPSGHREALRRRVIEDQSYAELAAALGISEQTARARVSRALRRLAGAVALERGAGAG